MSRPLKDIEAEKFRELTRGLSARAAAINIFNFIRDIPYYIDLEHFEFDNGPGEMLASGRGSCFPKHFLLGGMLTELGFGIEYYLYSFFWKDQALAMSEEALKRAAKIPATYHTACKIRSGREWLTLDATWNKELSKMGFSVNDNWDGKSATKLAIVPFEETKFKSGREVFSFVQKKFGSYSLGERLELSRFTIEFNRWIGKVENNGRGK